MKCLKDFGCSKNVRWVIAIIAVVIVLLVVFQAGRFVGFRQAIFSGHLGDNYYRAFEGPKRGPMGKMIPRGFWSDDLPNGHGAIGKIIKITLPTIVVLGPDDVEKIVKVGDETLVRSFRDTIKVGDLKVGDMIVTIGTADDSSQIVAKLIRLLPPLPTPPASTTPKQ